MRQLSLPVALELPEDVMREAHRRLGLRVSFAQAMDWPPLRACLLRSAALRAAVTARRSKHE